jgi:hypothetical protein
VSSKVLQIKFTIPFSQSDTGKENVKPLTSNINIAKLIVDKQVSYNLP